MGNRLFLTVGLLLLISNLLFLFSRDKIGQFKQFSNKEELYESKQADPSNWTPYGHPFREEEVKAAQKILTDSIRIDTTNTDEQKVLAISNFLYSKIHNRPIKAIPQITASSPLDIYQKLCKSQNLKFQCGEGALLQSLFLTAIGVKSRLVQHFQKPNTGLAPDAHVYNEVWLKEIKSWAMTDFFQNRHLIKKNNQFLSAAIFMDSICKNPNSPFQVIYTDTTDGQIAISDTTIDDPYFSNSYELAIYSDTDPHIVYSLKNRVRHYLFEYAHLHYYANNPIRVNLLYRLKQTLFITGILWCCIFAYYLFQHRNDRGKKHT
jgi:hypothetical protein